MDIVGPLPPSEDHRYLLTIVDRHSRWPEAIPLKEISAASCAAAFIRCWLPRYGVPDSIVTDRGAQFTGALWRDLLEQLGVTSLSTMAYHPQANGMVERMHRQLKAALKARLNDASWMDELPLVLLGMRSAWREGPESTPAELLYGESLRLPGQMVPGVAPITPSSGPVAAFFQRMRSMAPTPSAHHSAHRPFLPASLRTASYVYVRHDAVRRPLQRPYDGPYKVLATGDKTFTILRQDTPYVVSVDRLKPAVTPPLSPSEVQPPALSSDTPPPSAPHLNLKPPVLSGTSAPPTLKKFRDEDFPPLPPTKPYQTNYGRISKPPSRFMF